MFREGLFELAQCQLCLFFVRLSYRSAAGKAVGFVVRASFFDGLTLCSFSSQQAWVCAFLAFALVSCSFCLALSHVGEVCLITQGSAAILEYAPSFLFGLAFVGSFSSFAFSVTDQKSDKQ